MPLAGPASFPKLVISGGWESAPGLYRERGGVPLMACARVTADRIGARHMFIADSAHYPHVDSPERLNDVLADLWN